MRFILYLSALIVILLTISWETKAQLDSFQLRGKIKGLKEGKIYLNYYLDKESRLIKDSCMIRNGRFIFQNRLDEAMVGSIKLSRANTVDENSTFIFLEPAAMKIRVRYKRFQDAQMKGSVSQKQYEVLQTKKKRLAEKYKNGLDLLRTEKDSKKRDSLRTVLAPYFAANDQIDYFFFDAHPESFVTLYTLQYHFGDLSLDSLQLFFNRLPEGLRNHLIGRQLTDRINRLKGGSVGSTAKEFATVDQHGDSVRLSDFRGKYVLLDFWASWCVPCRKENPLLIELYHKYQTRGFRIISIADDDSKPELWRKAIANDQTGIWVHVLRGFDMAALQNGRNNEMDISGKYGVSVLPTKILINPAGVIIARIESEGGGLENKLAEIFK